MAQTNIEPVKQHPNQTWEHFEVWQKVLDLLEAMPNYFKSEILIKGINVTDIYSVGNLFSAVIEAQIVNTLNKLRHIWDLDNNCSSYAFVRQSQTFPDILFVNIQNNRDVIFGIELKAWYVFSKESEPSFKYTITPDACAKPDLLVVVPWFLSEVISGSPNLMFPFIELGKYAAEYRNYYWIKSRETSSTRSNSIISPPQGFRHPYPQSKVEASDKAENDKGNNFGRIARAGLLDNYLEKIKRIDYLGIRVSHWMRFFKAMSENKTSAEIDGQLDTILANIISDIDKNRPVNDHQIVLQELIEGLKKLKDTLSK
ncbi:MAG: hypothetical protein HC817_02115 [Saprospiraceae bacterium]|nr:hypothetical protein [Saprospiraceae bacterium]